MQVRKFLSLRDGPAERPIQDIGSEPSFKESAMGAALRTGNRCDKAGDIKAPTFGVEFIVSNFALDYAGVPQARILNRVSKFSVNRNYRVQEVTGRSGSPGRSLVPFPIGTLRPFCQFIGTKVDPA